MSKIILLDPEPIQEKTQHECVEIYSHEKQNKLLLKTVVAPGCKIWEFDMVKMKVVEIKPSVILGQSASRTFTTRPNCKYCVAINKSNAVRKFVESIPKATAENYFQRMKKKIEDAKELEDKNAQPETTMIVEPVAHE